MPSARPVHPDAVMEPPARWAPWREILLNIVFLAAGVTVFGLAFDRLAWPLWLSVGVYAAVFVAWMVALRVMRRRAAREAAADSAGVLMSAPSRARWPFSSAAP